MTNHSVLLLVFYLQVKEQGSDSGDQQECKGRKEIRADWGEQLFAQTAEVSFSNKAQKP